jgi:maleylacetate reductase
MIPSRYESLPSRALLGRGTVGQVSAEIARLGSRRVIVLSLPEQSEQAESIAKQRGSARSATCTGAATHTPLDARWPIPTPIHDGQNALCCGD